MAQSAFLKVALVGPTDGVSGVAKRLGAHTVAVAQHLAEAGHDVTLVSWTGAAGTGRTGQESFPRTVRALARNRPDTWVRAGRRLRGYDAVVIVHTGAAMVPLHHALLSAAGIRRAEAGAADGGPRGVLLCDAVLPVHPRAATRNLVSSVLGRVHGVLVHHREEAPLAARLGAARVYAVEQPDRARRPLPLVPALAGDGAGGRRPADTTDLSAPWAAYVGAIEALAAPAVAATDLGEAPTLERRGPAARLAAALDRAGGAVRSANRLVDALTPGVQLTRSGLPEWLRPTDLLDDAWQADEARDEARRLGLPRVRDGVAAWAALGALAAVVRLADDSGRASVVVDESGTESPFGRWARVCGFAPVDLGLTVVGGGYDTLDVDPASLDVVVRVHPGGCDASDVDEAVSQAAWAVRPGGLLVLTVPLGRPGAELALGPADVRAVVARAHEHGFVLVGDLDGEVGTRMRAAARAAEASPARREDAAYGLVRLTLRRR